VPLNTQAAYAIAPADRYSWPVVYAFGGRKPDQSLDNALYQGIPVVDDVAGTAEYRWRRIGTSNAPSSRLDAALAVSADGRVIYVVGGRSSTGAVLGDVYAYSLDRESWSAVSLSLPIVARAEAGIAVQGDTLFVAGGVNSSGYELADLVRIDGVTGRVVAYGNAVPAGAAPDLSVAPHGDGLTYAGGRVGGYWFRDVWRIDLTATTATARFIHDFGGDGLVATTNFAVQADLRHELYWGVPGSTATGDAKGVWFFDGTSGSSQGSVGGGPLSVSPSDTVAAAETTGAAPTRSVPGPSRSGQRGLAGRAELIRPGTLGIGPQ
jgi:hypothetical protein